jgi:hypothetical protein
VLNEPFVAKPLPIRYVEGRQNLGTGGVLTSKGGIPVSGGIVTIEPHVSRTPALSQAASLLQAVNPIGAASVHRDIVIWDPLHERELYRDGPYDAITVNRPLDRIVAEVNREGIEAFLTRIAGGVMPPGTVSITRTTPSQIYERAALTGFEYYWERFVRLFKRRK